MKTQNAISYEKQIFSSAFFTFVLGIAICLMLVLLMGDVLLRKLKKPLPGQEANKTTFNNQAKNPMIISLKVLIVILCLFIPGYVSIYHIPYVLDSRESDRMLYRRMSFHFISNVVVPMFTFLANDKVRRFYYRSFWDWAPDCVQKYNPNNVVQFSA